MRFRVEYDVEMEAESRMHAAEEAERVAEAIRVASPHVLAAEVGSVAVKNLPAASIAWE